MNKKTKNEKTIMTSKHDEIFTLVKNPNGTVAIVVGEYKAVQKDFNDFKEAEMYIGRKPYKLIFNTFQILQNYANKHKEQETAQKVAENATDN